MVTPGNAAPLGRVILGTTGQGVDWQTLRDHLQGHGWQVDLFDPSPLRSGDELSPEGALPLLHGVDLAILLATSPDRGSDPAANQRLIDQGGLLERALGPSRVLFIREHDVPSMVGGSDLPELIYRPGQISDLFPGVLARLAQNSVGPEKQPQQFAWLERFGWADRRPAPEMLMLLSCVVVFVAVIAAISWLARDTGPGPLSAEVASPQVGSGVDAAAEEDTTAANGDVVLGLPDEGGSVRGLPAICVIDTRRGLVAPEVVPCQGIGGVKVDGYRGPWHNEFGTVRPDLGVVAEAFMEVGDNIGGVPLIPDVDNDMAAIGARGGVEQLIVVFTADGQQVGIGQRSDRGANEATLTFGIDLG